MTELMQMPMVQTREHPNSTEYSKKQSVWGRTTNDWLQVSEKMGESNLNLDSFQLSNIIKALHLTTRTTEAKYPWDNPISQFMLLAEAIRISKELLDMPDGSEFEGPKPPDKETWEKGCRFLWRHAEKLLDFSNAILEAPYITATPFGGLGFYWKKATYRMLITIRHGEDRVTYYGDNTKWEHWEEQETNIDETDTRLISWFTLIYE